MFSLADVAGDSSIFASSFGWMWRIAEQGARHSCVSGGLKVHRGDKILYTLAKEYELVHTLHLKVFGDGVIWASDDGNC